MVHDNEEIGSCAAEALSYILCSSSRGASGSVAVAVAVAVAVWLCGCAAAAGYVYSEANLLILAKWTCRHRLCSGCVV